MVNDNAIVYNAKVLKAEIKIKNISSLGIDVSQFNEQLKVLKNKLDKNIDESKLNELETAKKMNLEMVYISAINEVEKFIISLSHYEKYFITMSKCSCISDIIDEGKIDSNKLDSMVEDMIDCLKMIRESETIEYDEEEKAVEELYATVYSLIKFEIKINGSSKLLNYCKDNEIDCIFLSKLILLEIDKIDISKIDISSIKRRMNEINSSQNSDSMYLDEDLLKIMYSCKNEEEILRELKTKANELSERYKEYLKKIKKEQEKYEVLKQNNYSIQFIDFIKQDKKKLKKDILKSVTSLTIFSAALVTLITGTWKFSKDLCTDKTYLTETTSYSSITDDLTQKPDEYIPLKSEERSIILTKYYPWKKDLLDDYERKVISYDLSDIDLANLKDYTKLDLEKLGRTGEKTSENKEELNLDDLYDKEFTIVTKFEQHEDKVNVILDISDPIFMTSLLSLVISLIFEALSPESWGVISAIIYLKNSLETTSYYDHKKKYFESQKEVDEILKKINELTDGKLKIEVEFNNLYNNERYKHLIEQTTELSDEVIDNGGTLVLKKG